MSDLKDTGGLPNPPRHKSPSASPQSNRGSAQDFTQFGERAVRDNTTDAVPSDQAVEIDRGPSKADGSGLYAPPTRKR